MSYILDALKKAERERHAVRVPTLRTVHAPPPGGRARWPFYVAGLVIAANVALGAVLLRGGGDAPASDAVVASAVAPSTAAPSPATPLPAVAPPLAGAPAPAPAAVAPAPAAGQKGAAPESLRERAREPLPSEREPHGTISRARPDPSRREVARAAPPVSGTAAPGPATSAPPAAVPAAPASAPAAPASPAASAPRYRAEPPAAAGAPAAAPSRAVGKGAGPLSPLAEMPAAFQTALPKLRLQVLVYDRSEADAWVFINNRKYVVGDRLGDDITLERITEDGAILGFEGRRYLLKQ